MAGITAAVIYSRQPKAIPVRTTPVERMEKLVSLVNAQGEIRAHDMVDIQTEVAGVIKDLPVVEGQRVKMGDVLLKIDQFQSQMEMDSQEGHYMSAQSDVRRAEQAIATAQSNMARQQEIIKTNESELAQAEITHQRDLSSLKRYEELLKVRAISLDEFEAVESKSRISSKQVDSAKLAIMQAQEQLRASAVAVDEQKVQKIQSEHNLAVADAARKRAKDQLNKTILTSPLNGVIVKLNVDIGERAVPGIQSNPQATLMTLADLSKIEAELKVNETDIVRVKLGQTAKITVDALVDVTSLTGHVSEISSAPIDMNANKNNNNSSGQDSKDFKVVISVDNPPPALRLGMLCEADITIETRQNALTVPIAALTPRQGEVDEKGAYVTPPKPAAGQGAGKAAMAEDAKPAAGAAAGGKGGRKKKAGGNKKEFQGVFVKRADGMAHFCPVKTGIMGDMEIELLDGVKEGDEVITGPLQSLRLMDEWSLVREETEAERGMGTTGPK